MTNHPSWATGAEKENAGDAGIFLDEPWTLSGPN
jgi:hypothetical protein